MKKIDKYKKRRIVFYLIIILIIIFIIRTIVIKKSSKPEIIKLVFGSEVIKLTDEIYSDSFNNFFMSKEEIKKLFDPNIYYDESENMLITTFNKHVAILYLEDYNMEINGSKISIEAALMKHDDKIYLPFSEMGIVYDFEFSYSEDSNTIIIDSISKAKKEGTSKNSFSKLKKSPKLFGGKIQRLKKNEKLLILDEQNNYYYVRTEKGNFGYIKKNKVKDISQVREDMEDAKLNDINILDNKNVLKNYSNLELDSNKKNVIMLDLFEIKNKEVKNIIDLDTENFKEFASWAEDNDVLLVGNVICKDETDKAFSDYKDREKIINEIYNSLFINKIRGINISFDKINDVDSFYRLIIEMAPKFRESGIKTLVTNNDALDLEKLESIADFVIK